MSAAEPTILATSGGYLSHPRLEVAFGPLVDYAVDLSGVGGRPKIAHLGTASGDQRAWHAELDDAARLSGFDLTHITLFPMPNVEDVRATILAQDVIWVGGGSVANLLAVWEVHNLRPALYAAWQAGVVLAGVSAGSICWFRGGTTDSFGPELRAVTNGLGLLPYGNGVHYDSEERRRPLVHRLVADGTLPVTHCTDDGVGLVYRGTELVEVVSERDSGAAYVVAADPTGDGGAVEERIEPRRLL